MRNLLIDFNTSSMSSIPHVIGSEAFSVKVETPARQHTFGARLRGCWGNFTKSTISTHEGKVQFTIYFNLVNANSTLKELVHVVQPGSSPLLWLYDVPSTKETCRNEFAFLKSKLKSFVKFRYRCVFNTDEHVFHYVNYPIPTNSSITFTFEQQPMYKIFFVLNMYRTFLKQSTTEAYWWSKKLAAKNWHNLSFVNLMLMCDMVTSKPGDSQIGYEMQYSNIYKWLNAKEFRKHNYKSRLNLQHCIFKPFKKRGDTQYLNHIPALFGWTTCASYVKTPEEIKAHLNNLYQDITDRFKSLKQNS